MDPQIDTSPLKKPENGIAGLKHWRQDIVAGFLVAMISTPFSIGIAVASGAPPITGLTSAIIAGFVLPFLGGSYVTISGPAAGLAPVLYGAMLTLGAGSLAAGYPLLLPVICLAGILQLILSKLKAARFSAMFPAPVVEGMLAAIGLMIIAKQLPTLLGHSFHSHEFWGMLLETPQELAVAHWDVVTLGLLTIATILVAGWIGKDRKWAKVVPPQVLAVGIGTALSYLFFNLDPKFLIHIPANPLQQGIVMPDVMGLISNPSLWFSAISIALTLTLVDGIESLATINAVDKIDPYHRKSNPDKTLFAMGVSNICSSLVGGLTIIPGGVKSTANIMAGGRTQWANFYNASFLLIFLLFFHQQISTIPLVVLSAVLVMTGYKLCCPKVWKIVGKSGMEQLALFIFTVVVTLTTDLMVGILSGVALSLVINFVLLLQTAKERRTKSCEKSPPLTALVSTMFQNPVTLRDWQVEKDNAYHLYLAKPMVCSNYMHLSRELAAIPGDVTSIHIHITDKVCIIDHTTMDNLIHWMVQHQADGGAPVELHGLDQLRKLADTDNATRMIDLEYEQVALAG
jgi:carbonic anhydrase